MFELETCLSIRYEQNPRSQHKTPVGTDTRARKMRTKCGRWRQVPRSEFNQSIGGMPMHQLQELVSLSRRNHVPQFTLLRTQSNAAVITHIFRSAAPTFLRARLLAAVRCWCCGATFWPTLIVSPFADHSCDKLNERELQSSQNLSVPRSHERLQSIWIQCDIIPRLLRFAAGTGVDTDNRE